MQGQHDRRYNPMKLKSFLILLLVNSTVLAQTDPATLSYVVSGNVTDAEDGRPLQYVNVTIPGLQYATVSNPDGAFAIKSATAPEYPEFTLLGYKTSRAGVPSGPSSPLAAKMRKNILTSNEAIIYSGDPYKILKEAAEKIEDNQGKHRIRQDCRGQEPAESLDRATDRIRRKPAQ